MIGRDGTTTFLPLNTKIGGQVNNNRPSIGQFLMTANQIHIQKKQNQMKKLTQRQYNKS